MINSVTEILKQLPFSVLARKEIYHHPFCKIYLPGICGEFGEATKDEKVLSCKAPGEEHAVVIYDISTSGEIKMKNSYDYDRKITKKINPTDPHHEPEMGTFVSFQPVTISKPVEPDFCVATLIEMGFDENDIQNGVEKYPNDFHAALTYCYSKQV